MGDVLGRRQAFFYWRLAHEHLVPAVAALRGWQADLMAEDPALRARLFVRHEAIADADAPATLMEAYAFAAAHSAQAGIDAATMQRLIDEGHRLTTPWRLGARHAEVFDATDGAEPLN